MNIAGIAITLSCLIPSPLSPLQAPPAYRLIDLGPRNFGTCVNSRGQVAGTHDWSYGARHAFLFSPGSNSASMMQDLGAMRGIISEGYGINDSGQVTGYSSHAFLYSGGVMHDLGTLIGAGALSEGDGINASGEVTGWSNAFSGRFELVHAFIYSGGRMKDLGTLLGTAPMFSVGSGINDSGQVTGTSGTNGLGRAFLYSGGVMRDLGALPGDTFSEGNAINALGQVTGCSYRKIDGPRQAFLYSDGVMQGLGNLAGGTGSTGCGINASGQVVGVSYGSEYFLSHAFLYSGGVMYDLNDLVSSSGAVLLQEALSISDNGYITGFSLVQGSEHGFLLAPMQ